MNKVGKNVRLGAEKDERLVISVIRAAHIASRH